MNCASLRYQAADCTYCTPTFSFEVNQHCMFNLAFSLDVCWVRFFATCEH
jgi:hypothetical protein